MKELGSTGPNTGSRLLVVDDDEQIRRLLTLLLKRGQQFQNHAFEDVRVVRQLLGLRKWSC